MMDILAWLGSVFSSSTFWIIFLILVLTGILGVVRYFRRWGLTKGKLLLIGVIGLFLALGGASMLGVGSVGTTDSSGVTISQLQTVTAYTMNSTTITDVGTDDTRMSEFYPSEGDLAGNDPITTGVFLVTRTGDLKPASCLVQVHKPPRYDISDTTYHIVDEDASTGVMYAYVYTGTSSTSATSSDPKETNQLAFAEGVSTGYVSFNITIDETGFDPLTQYDYKDINVDICGYPYTFRVHKADA